MVYFLFRLWFWFSFASFLSYNPTTHVRRQWYVWIKHRRNNTTHYTGTRLLVHVNTLFISVGYSSPFKRTTSLWFYCIKMICQFTLISPKSPLDLVLSACHFLLCCQILLNILRGLVYFHFRLINALRVTVDLGNVCVLPEREHFVFVCNLLCL